MDLVRSKRPDLFVLVARTGQVFLLVGIAVYAWFYVDRGLAEVVIVGLVLLSPIMVMWWLGRDLQGRNLKCVRCGRVVSRFADLDSRGLCGTCLADIRAPLPLR